MTQTDKLIEILETSSELDRMYLEAINSQAETLHITLLAVAIIGIFQAVIYLKITKIEK